MNNKKKRSPSWLKTTKLFNPDHLWSSLPGDILITIAELLASPDGTNFVRFGAVCRSWCSAAAQVTYTLARQMPWIILPALNNSMKIKLFNPSENKSYKFPLQMEQCRTLCGSINGWVAIEGDEHILLINLNPFIGQNQLISHLPPLDDPITYSVRKLCLPMSPIENPDGMALAIYGVEQYDCCVPIGTGLAFAKLGSRAWATISCSTWAPYNDAVSYKGMFYAVNYCGVVVELDLERQQAVEIASLPVSVNPNNDQCYLVESAGDLLKVVQHSDSGFNVFKLDVRSGECEVVKSLWERSLFIGRLSYSISVAALALFRCMSNCIYFINEHNNGIATMVVFSLEEDKNIETQTISQFKSCRSSPLWVSPFVSWHRSDDPSGSI